MPIGTTELLIILALVLLLFGSTKLPELGRSLGRTGREFAEGLRDRPSDSVRPAVEEERRTTDARHRQS